MERTANSAASGGPHERGDEGSRQAVGDRGDRVGHLRPVGGLAAVELPRRDPLRDRPAARRPQQHVLAPTNGASIPVDTGFIVYNETTYPNLTALFAHLGVETEATEMSFAVSMDGGRLEYAGSNLAGLLAQPSNLARPRFYAMMADLLRFYRRPARSRPARGRDARRLSRRQPLRPRLPRGSPYPMAAAIWSTPAGEVGAYPAEASSAFATTTAS